MRWRPKNSFEVSRRSSSAPFESSRLQETRQMPETGGGASRPAATAPARSTRSTRERVERAAPTALAKSTVKRTKPIGVTNGSRQPNSHPVFADSAPARIRSQAPARDGSLAWHRAEGLQGHTERRECARE